MPPRCISGRWGAIDNCEIRLLTCRPDHIYGVFEAVFDKSKRAQDADDPSEQSLVTTLDEDQIKDAAAHRLKLGRWRKAALAALQDNEYWTIMKIAHKVRRPQRHFHNFLKKGGTTHFPTMAELVFGKAEAILAEYTKLLKGAAWELIVEATPLSMPAKELILQISTLVVQGAADINRRVARRATALATYRD